MKLVRHCEKSQEIARIWIFLLLIFEPNLCKKKTSEKEDNFCKLILFVENYHKWKFT